MAGTRLRAKLLGGVAAALLSSTGAVAQDATANFQKWVQSFQQQLPVKLAEGMVTTKAGAEGRTFVLTIDISPAVIEKHGREEAAQFASEFFCQSIGASLRAGGFQTRVDSTIEGGSLERGSASDCAQFASAALAQREAADLERSKELERLQREENEKKAVKAAAEAQRQKELIEKERPTRIAAAAKYPELVYGRPMQANPATMTAGEPIRVDDSCPIEASQTEMDKCSANLSKNTYMVYSQIFRFTGSKGDKIKIWSMIDRGSTAPSIGSPQSLNMLAKAENYLNYPESSADLSGERYSYFQLQDDGEHIFNVSFMTHQRTPLTSTAKASNRDDRQTYRVLIEKLSPDYQLKYH